MKIKPCIIALALIIAIFCVWKSVDGWQGVVDDSWNNQPPAVINRPPVNKDRIQKLAIADNSTYGALMSGAGVDSGISSEIFTAAKEIYDLSNIRSGRTLDLYYDLETDKLKRLVYQIDSEEELFIKQEERRAKNEDVTASTSEEIMAKGWIAERRRIEYEIKEKAVAGELQTSLYQWALDNNVDVRAIIDLADAYQWTIDFAIDPRIGDTFKFIYEERYRDNAYVMPGKILAAEYVNAGQDYQIFYFEEDGENKGYYNEAGNSVQREFLKAPIQYKYITSGFTTGLRCLESFGLCTNHRAIDYAAALGTPIRAVGDGTVIFSGWNSQGYGNLTSIRHNETYVTNYAHQSKISVKVGQKVKQGEIIGKVGSTGLSTGPHLHYEIVKHGVKINPLALELPPGRPVKAENLERFKQIMANYQKQLAGQKLE